MHHTCAHILHMCIQQHTTRTSNIHEHMHGRDTREHRCAHMHRPTIHHAHTHTCTYVPHMHTHRGQNCVRVEAGESRAPWGPTHLPHVGTAECNTGAMRTESGMDSEREATQCGLARLFLYLKGSESINAVPQTPASAPRSSVHSQKGARTDPAQGERSRGQGHTVGWAPGSVPSTCSTSSSFWPPTQH